MKNIKIRIIIYALLAATAITLLAVYSQPIAKAVAPITEFTVKLFL